MTRKFSVGFLMAAAAGALLVGPAAAANAAVPAGVTHQEPGWGGGDSGWGGWGHRGWHDPHDPWHNDWHCDRHGNWHGDEHDRWGHHDDRCHRW